MSAYQDARGRLHTAAAGGVEAEDIALRMQAIIEALQMSPEIDHDTRCYLLDMLRELLPGPAQVRHYLQAGITDDPDFRG